MPLAKIIVSSSLTNIAVGAVIVNFLRSCVPLYLFTQFFPVANSQHRPPGWEWVIFTAPAVILYYLTSEGLGEAVLAPIQTHLSLNVRRWPPILLFNGGIRSRLIQFHKQVWIHNAGRESESREDLKRTLEELDAELGI